MDGVQRLDAHANELNAALSDVASCSDQLERWAACLVEQLHAGQRLLLAGNGGSDAIAEHIAAEFAGRFEGTRKPLSAMSLHSSTAAVTAVANDFGFEHVTTRLVAAYAKAGDILLCLSTSGKSPNLVLAAESAREMSVLTWAITGDVPNPLANASDDSIAVAGRHKAVVQEVQLVLLHTLCALVDTQLGQRASGAAE